MHTTKFVADKNVLTVTRVFDASLELVWRAWTEADLLDQWWAPKPWQSKTKSMEFKEGAHRIYAMVGPNGEEHWARTNYLEIVKHQYFTGEDAFCDSDGNINPELPVAKFKNQFTSVNEQTYVKIVTAYASEVHLQQVLNMGMQEGLNMAFENLEQLLVSRQKD